MTKAERLKYMRENFPKYRKDEEMDSGGGVIAATSGDIAEVVDRLNPFHEEQRDRKNIQGKINSDD